MNASNHHAGYMTMAAEHEGRMIGRALVLALASFVLLCAACGNGEDPPPLNGNNGGGGNGNDNGPEPSRAWSTETVTIGGVGLQTRLSVGPGDRVAIAHHSIAGRNDGPCEELGISDPPDRMRWRLLAAIHEGGSWSEEIVAEPPLVGAPRGLDIAFSPQGRIVVAGPSGDPIQRVGSSYCGANDLGLYWREGEGSWALETAAEESGQAAIGHGASDSGDVVGFWPALTFDPDTGEPLSAYQDRHFGGLQSDDRDRADLELAWRRGGSWTHIPIDMTEGAGLWSDMGFDHAGNPVIVYYVPDVKMRTGRRGLWASRSVDGGESWTRVQFLAGRTAERPTVAYQPQTGRLLIAYYDGHRGQPFLAHVSSDASFDEELDDGWEIERIGDSRYDEGYFPSVAVASDGRIGVAYYRCVRSSRELGECDPQDDALVFAWRDEDGSWTREIVDAGGRGMCGSYSSLGFLSGNEAVVAYQCVREYDDGGDEPAFEHVLKMAKREALP